MNGNRTLIALSLTILLVACGDDGTPPADTGTTDTGTTDTGTTDTGTTDTGATDTGTMDSGTDGGCTATGDERTWLACTDGVDNDCDGMVDTDPDCSICPPEAAPEAGDEDSMASCTDGIDNDCDGRADCEDSDCIDMAPGCADEGDDETLCSDGLDNDGDRRVDCAERACASTMACRPAAMGTEDDVTLCANGLDDDYDGFTDCDDDDCEATAACGDEDTDATCMDGLDNDGDGRTDCVDGGCSDATICMSEAAACGNGMDDDMDGYVDCADGDCIGSADCVDAETVCDDTLDDDLDGRADCQDEDCMAGCTGDACSATNWFGTCAAGETCAMGVCAMPLSSYDFSTDQPLRIVEIMADSSVAADNDGEYAEILNVSTDTIDVNGLTLNDDDAMNTTSIVGPRPLAPGERLMFVANADPTENGGIANGVEFDFGFNNGGDQVAIQHMGTDIHRVTYAGTGNDLTNTGGDVMRGQSFNMNQAFIDGTTTSPVWCYTPAEAATEYNSDATDMDYGTPDADNVVCM